MDKEKRVVNISLIASVLAFVICCVYPTVFIKWNVPLYAVCVLALTATAFLYFFALFTAKKKNKPALKAAIGAAGYLAVLMGVTPLVNNVIFGGVAPWGAVLAVTALDIIFWIVMLVLIRKASGARLEGKRLVCLLLVIAGFPISSVATLPNFKATGFIVFDTPSKYEERIATIDIYENTIETALPQTDVYRLMTEHLNAPLPEGKTSKKILVLGWDGCRADAMAMTDHREAVDALLADGGKAYIAYCGGARYPDHIIQDTSTAPGWCTMLTGKWADENGMSANGESKDLSCPSLLVSAVADGLIDSSSFCFSWNGHLTTYANEMEFTKEHSLNVKWNFAEDGDDGTFANALADIQSEDCSDLIFTIFEYCDEYGHGYGFWNETPEYENAFKLSNEKGLALIEAVRARPTYDSEDWLILISSDHGGFVRGHGGETLMERMMFIITSA